MIKLSEYLGMLDFSYKVNNDNTISLVDLQKANLARIESEKFEINSYLPMMLSDRLTTYEDDYFFNDIIQSLREEFNYNGEIYPYDLFVLPEMKKHPEFFSKNCISFIEDVLTYNIDISELFKTKYKEDLKMLSKKQLEKLEKVFKTNNLIEKCRLLSNYKNVSVEERLQITATNELLLKHFIIDFNLYNQNDQLIYYFTLDYLNNGG